MLVQHAGKLLTDKLGELWGRPDKAQYLRVSRRQLKAEDRGLSRASALYFDGDPNWLSSASTGLGNPITAHVRFNWGRVAKRNGHAIVDLRATDKAQLLHELTRRAVAAPGFPADQMSDALLKRQALGSTGTGGGIAMPHARLSGVSKPFGVLRPVNAIEFDAIDGEAIEFDTIDGRPAREP